MANVWLSSDECTRDGALPGVCMKCGANAENYVRKQFSWCPSWVIVLILAGVLIWAIIAMILTKRMAVYVPLCDEHKGIFTKRALLVALFVVLALGSIAAGIGMTAAMANNKGANDLAGFSILAGGVLMLVFLIVAAIISKAGIQPTEITDTEIKLKNVHEDFVDAVREMRREDREERRSRRRGRDDDDEDEEEDDDDYRDRRRRRRDDD